MRLMYDAVNPLNIPADAEMVVYYTTGNYTWSAADKARFKSAMLIGCDTTGGLPLESPILDVEPGNLGVPAVTPEMTASQVEAIWAELCTRARAWVTQRHAHNLGSTCYIQASRKQQLAEELKGLPVVFWMASTGISQESAEKLIQGAEVAIQFVSEPGYDVSVVDDKWYPVPAPKTTPAAPALKSVTITATYSDGSKKEVTY